MTWAIKYRLITWGTRRNIYQSIISITTSGFSFSLDLIELLSCSWSKRTCYRLYKRIQSWDLSVFVIYTRSNNKFAFSTVIKNNCLSKEEWILVKIYYFIAGELTPMFLLILLCTKYVVISIKFVTFVIYLTVLYLVSNKLK